MKRFTRIIQGIFLIVTLIALGSCNMNTLSIPEYIGYVRSSDKGLSDFKVHNGYVFNVLYEPSDYLALKELRNEKVTVNNFFETRKKFSDYLYFDFSIKPESYDKKVLDKNDSANYEKRFNHFAFDFPKDIFLISKSDTLPCLLHQFTSSSGISPECHFELMFNKPVGNLLSGDSLVLVYEDKLLDSGKIKLFLLNERITNIPQLKI